MCCVKISEKLFQDSVGKAQRSINSTNCSNKPNAYSAMLVQLEIYAKPASWRNDFCNQNYHLHANANDESFKALPVELYLLTQFRILLNFAQAHDFQNI